VQNTAGQRNDKKRTGAPFKATRQGHSMSGFVEGLSSQCNARQSIAAQSIELQSN